MSLELETVRVDDDGPVRHLVLNRPEVHNAVNSQLIADVHAACLALDADPSVRVVIVRGEGRSLSSGADLKQKRGTSLDAMLGSKAGARMYDTLMHLTAVTICLCHGYLFGWCGVQRAIGADGHYLVERVLRLLAGPDLERADGVSHRVTVDDDQHVAQREVQLVGNDLDILASRETLGGAGRYVDGVGVAGGLVDELRHDDGDGCDQQPAHEVQQQGALVRPAPVTPARPNVVGS